MGTRRVSTTSMAIYQVDVCKEDSSLRYHRNETASMQALYKARATPVCSERSVVLTVHLVTYLSTSHSTRSDAVQVSLVKPVRMNLNNLIATSITKKVDSAQVKRRRTSRAS